MRGLGDVPGYEDEVLSRANVQWHLRFPIFIRSEAWYKKYLRGYAFKWRELIERIWIDRNSLRWFLVKSFKRTLSQAGTWKKFLV